MTEASTPAVTVIWPVAELRMMADALGPAFHFIAGAIRGCLAEEQGGMNCLATFYAPAWGTHEDEDVQRFAATVRDYAEAAMRLGRS